MVIGRVIKFLTLVILAPGRLRKKDPECQASQGSLAGFCLKENNNNNNPSAQSSKLMKQICVQEKIACCPKCAR